MSTYHDSFPLPENCSVRLIDLDTKVDGLLTVGEDGFLNVYLNARLSRDAQRRALRHELRHYMRGDLYSDEDIRAVERGADAPVPLLAIDGTPLPAPAEVFDPMALRPVGRGLYLPLGDNLARAAADIGAAARGLREAIQMFDVLQTPPWLAADRLTRLADGLCADDIAFIGWQPPGSRLPVAMQLCREDGDRLFGALYYDPRGRLHDALFTLEAGAERLTMDLRRRRGALSVCAICRQPEGRGAERLY